MFRGSFRFLSSQSVSTIFSSRFSSIPAAENAKDSVIDLTLNSVVKVFCLSSTSSVLQPWQKKLPTKKSGSGFVISNNKILTNAHVVSDHTFVQVRKHDSPTKFKAKVETVGHDCDLAILKINSKKFWKDLKPLDLGDVPPLNETVFVVGFPRGGDNISITKGVVSRVEVTKYAHSKAKLMTIQTDAAINSGNSGGPAFMDNKVIGVAFQGLTSSQNIGYIIPTPIVKHFITSVEENVQFPGFCSLGISCQSMENAGIRRLFKMTPKMTGTLIRRVDPLSSCYGILKEKDVLLSVDGVSVGNDQTVVLRKTESIDFNHLVSMKKPCEKTSLQILREGKKHVFSINIKPVKALIPEYKYDMLPSYYIFAGFVFLPLTQAYMDIAPVSESLPGKVPKTAGEQIVILSQQILEDDINTGYRDLEDLQVKEVNGVRVDNMKHLLQLIEKCCTDNLRLDLERGYIINIDYKSGKNVSTKILRRYGIPNAMSKDLQSLKVDCS
ncbi:unnamed protein product [Eruca vesicaria subsp. sativa]|uniref:Protease Do-like PDZ domain-containing protein n=1 Tax=Eruca vesicaria subsp. sativa TaxID=29727 RepID=A0ABC8IZU5_ERUVS|nr:unnamed protein product [Eruca vesicaria subsp. sativa]